MQVRRLVVAASLLAALLPAVPGEAQARSCPEPRTCPSYTLLEHRWHLRPGQPLVIPYWVSTRLPAGFVTAEELPRLVRAATRVWERVNPRIRFAYQGTTDVLPGLRDGRNVIGVSVPQGVVHLEGADTVTWLEGPRVVEVDTNIDPTHEWVWHPCPQRDGGCAGHSRSFLPPGAGELWGPELQGVVEHELGHWLSLGHSDADRGADMTMSSVTKPDNLAQQTLGLGDVLGVRAAYPCGRCGGPPRVFSP